MSARPTIADLAKDLGVAPSTVSRALRNHPGISEERKAEVRAAARARGIEVSEGPTAPADDVPRAGVSPLVACVVPTISHPFFAQVIERLEAVCTQHDVELLLHSSGGSPAHEIGIVEALISRGVDGVFFVPASEDSSALDECAQKLRTVVITQQKDACPSIGVDHDEGGRLVAEHLKELGRRSVLLVGPTDDNSKFRGFRTYLESQRLTGIRTEVVDVAGWDAEVSMGAYRAMMGQFTRDSIGAYDAVFAFNDLAALGALHALADLGRSVPGDVAVCGFDDTPIAREIRPGLTSVAQPVNQIVRSAFYLLRRQMRGETIPAAERSLSLKPHLVVRGSTFGGS